MLYNDPEEKLLSAHDFFVVYFKGNEVFFEGRWFEAKRNNMAHYPPESSERENSYWCVIDVNLL